MSSSRNSNYERLEAKVAAIRVGTAEDKLNPAEAITFVCQYHTVDGMIEPIPLTALSRLSPSGRSGYLSEAIKDVHDGTVIKLSKNCAAFMANMTGKDLAFWRREHYSLADLESIQITLPHEVRPEPTITGPAIQSKAIVPPTARELAEAVLFPPHVNSMTVAKIMKAGATNRGDISR